MKTTITSFRPLAGIMVLIGEVERSGKNEGKCFRPLAGIMVLIITIKRRCVK